jgi:hypothetical protein
LAYKFLLARTAGVLKSPKHSRETMLEFKQDWASLQRASAEITISAGNATPLNSAHATLTSGGGQDGDSAQLP